MRKCKVCEIELTKRSSKIYCSNKCQAIERKNKRISEIGTDKKIPHQSIRKILIEMSGAKCQECGWDKINPHTGKCPIELDHIDGNSENNKLENLRLLCPNCHSLTSTYKALNKGRGRHNRMARYNEGKSY
jgi:5-methylcytosine-specific restriction endonuclease McrA